LQIAIKIDQDIATQNQMHLGKDAIGRQVVVGKGDVVQ
jgi:hypothetical protein